MINRESVSLALYISNSTSSKCFLSHHKNIKYYPRSLWLCPSRIQAQHSLQDPGASEASSGAQRLHDKPGPTGQPAQPCTHSLAQPEAQDTQVGENNIYSVFVHLCPLIELDCRLSPDVSVIQIIAKKKPFKDRIKTRTEGSVSS